jgi:hypothetical protein
LSRTDDGDDGPLIICPLSLDHLVGAGDERRWNFEAERLGSLEVDSSAAAEPTLVFLAT